MDFSSLIDLAKQFVSFFLHLDEHLNSIIQTYGTWTYIILFLIIFCETGLVVAPLLPGDSLLFAAGTFAASGSLNLGLVLALLLIAAILGDAVNYWVGNLLGPKVFKNPDSRIFKQEYLEKTQNFYDKYGTKTIIIARFVPIVRTFAPFVAGIGKMKYSTFLTYNIIGAVLWVLSCTLLGYFFGNIPIVKENFELAIFGIIGISVLPVAIEMWKHRSEKKQAATASNET
jgi:membrane-associated protein